MSQHTATILRRDPEGPPGPPAHHTMVSLLVVLLVLSILALLLVAGLVYVRHRRRAQRDHLSPLPTYDEKRTSWGSAASSHRRATARPCESILVCQEKQTLIENSTSPPPSPLPQIRITFPEEYDDAGKRVSGRVVVVRVGDAGVGLEPVADVPAHRPSQEEQRFHSVDLERVGGLVEKARNAPGFGTIEKL